MQRAIAIPFRQVHLDFHTSPHIPDVGRDFDAAAFVETLQRARVESVTCFSRCHHGLIYHDTELEGLRHPNLCRDLLAEQIEACHAAGIRAPIYITVGWDDLQGRLHPQWLERDARGRRHGPALDAPGFDRKLCLNQGGYLALLRRQTAEVLERFSCDGFFFDIVYQGPCACDVCRATMEDAGLDPDLEEHRRRHAALVLDRFKTEMTALVRASAPEASIFYNAGHVGPETRRTLDQVSHLEVESLPTGHWGYLHFPVTARFARTFGPPLVGLTAAFHTTWGDFGSYKSRAALEYETASMLAQGARCSVGDQLHPLGALDAATYRLIGQVYADVEAAQPWCEGATPVTEIGVFHPEAFAAADGKVDSAAAGACLMLEEGRHQFDFIGGEGDLSRYRIIVIPDRIRVGPRLAESLEAYLDGGGALLASHISGLAPDADRFALDAFGARCLGPSEHRPDYLVPGEALAGRDDLPGDALVMYDRAMKTAPARDAEILAGTRRPYFNREGDRFCSHLHAPPAGDAGYPSAVQRGRVIYLAHPVFSLYRRRAVPWCRGLVLGALSRLLPEPLVRCGGPLSLVTTLTWQPQHGRLVLHLLHYVPRAKGQEFPVVDDALELRDLRLSVRTGAGLVEARTVPDGAALPVTMSGPHAELTVPLVRGHQMVALQMDRSWAPVQAVYTRRQGG